MTEKEFKKSDKNNLVILSTMPFKKEIFSVKTVETCSLKNENMLPFNAILLHKKIKK